MQLLFVMSLTFSLSVTIISDEIDGAERPFASGACLESGPTAVRLVSTIDLATAEHVSSSLTINA